MTPGGFEKVGEQDVLAGLQRVEIVEADQAEQGGDRAGDTCSRRTSRLAFQSSFGAASEDRTLTGMPASEPGV